MTNTNKDFKETIEKIKYSTEGGVEFWYARELQEVLGYKDWDEFNEIVKTAKISCEKDNMNPSNHFSATKRMLMVHPGIEEEVEDIMLSRNGCDHIVENCKA